MATWYVSDAGLQAMGGQLIATSLLTAVTAGAANTPGGWAQMHAATGFETSLISPFIGQTAIPLATQNSQTLFDIGVGPLGQEIIRVSNVACGGNLQFAVWNFPLVVARGSRICVRLRSLVASKSCTMGMMVMGGGFGLEAGYRATTYGAVLTSTSRGTTLATPASANTESAWTVISAATTDAMRWMVVGMGAPDTATSSAANGLMDIGVGAAGLEAAIVTDIPYRTSINEDILVAMPMTYPVNLPAGVRLAARHRASVVAAAACPNITITGIS